MLGRERVSGTAVDTHSLKQLLKNSGFRAFLWTQFLGALNDNLYKTIVSLRAVEVAASAGLDYLSIAGAVFVLPFLLFSGYSGHLADKVSKRTVMISVKVFEIGAMTMGLAVFFTNRMEWMLAVLFLMALHSTIFSPAKYGFVPELLEDKDLSRANGLLEMTTFVAIVLGTSIGSFLFAFWSGAAWRMGVVMVGVAIAGLAVSFGIPRTAAVPTEDKFRWNPFAEVVTGTKHLLRDRSLWLTVVGISYFWMLGALFQLDLFFYGSEVLHASDVKIGFMVTALAVGIGAGSLAAGKLSGDRVDLGFVPVGSALMGLCSVALAAAKGSYGWSVAALAALGLASGLFIVPLNAFLQQRSERGEKGRMIATNNFFNTIGLMLAVGALWLFHDRLHVSPDKLILASGLATLAATVYVAMVLPDHLIRLVLRVMIHTLFRIRVEGRERVPRRGGALLVSNHVSLADGILISAAINRNVRFMIWKPYFDRPAVNWFFRQIHAISVGTNGPRDMVKAIAQAREELKRGHVVCIFAEGSITRTGGLQPFKRGLEKIAHGADVAVIPTHLDRLWGSVFSFAGGKFFAKWRPRIAQPVTVSFGEPAAKGASAQEVRQAVMELGSEAACLRKDRGDTLGERFIRSARRNWNRFAMADSSGRELTHGRALAGSLLVSDWARRNSTDGEMIGVLLPPSAGGALANMGLTLAGRVPVNLNFTAGNAAMAAAIEQCGIRTVITSKTFLSKAKIEATDGTVYLEDVLARVGRFAKAWAAARARIAPVRALLEGRDPDSLATVLFSSGSTSTPKGVMLSHYNVISNIEAVLQVFDLNEKDRIVGVLPFFHSFGFTVTLWLPAVSGNGVIYHNNPMDAKIIGEMIERYRGTLLLSTPTFATGYARKCTREQFASLRFVLVGAEKLRESAAKAFEDAFGLKMLEGYGCTEMAPAVAVNTAGYEAGRDSQSGAKAGSVGRPLPGVAVRIADPETLTPLALGCEGLLLVKGPNRMLGYLGQPEMTERALCDGWYNTGDIGVLDEDGFLTITDRLARFSKIGGEMAPHLKIEEAVLQATGGEPCCVTGIPDERKGERIAVLYTAAGISEAEVWQRLAATDLPKLWLPKREDIHRVDALPTLGTGKVDFRGVRAVAMERAAVSQKAPA
jgi:acyl-[acyl-carrier-protein]-phospholipid O-acyltransferase / long-chain-fatty-acid--[acyl-carrier-protein] ligase